MLIKVMLNITEPCYCTHSTKIIGKVTTEKGNFKVKITIDQTFV